jgi:hypothetical protein
MNVAFDITRHPDYRDPPTDKDRAAGVAEPVYGGLPGVPMADLDEATWQQLSPTQQRSVIASPMYRVPKDWRQAFQEAEAERQQAAGKRGQVVAVPVIIEADTPTKARATKDNKPADMAAPEVSHG